MQAYILRIKAVWLGVSFNWKGKRCTWNTLHWCHFLLVNVDKQLLNLGKKKKKKKRKRRRRRKNEKGRLSYLMSYIKNHIFELCRLKITRCIANYFLTLSPYPQIKIPILIIKESHSSTLLPFFSLKFFQLFFTGI